MKINIEEFAKYLFTDVARDCAIIALDYILNNIEPDTLLALPHRQAKKILKQAINNELITLISNNKGKKQ